jgi:MFS family permease
VESDYAAAMGAAGVERRVEVDEVDRLVSDEAAQDLQIVAVVKGVQGVGCWVLSSERVEGRVRRRDANQDQGTASPIGRMLTPALLTLLLLQVGSGILVSPLLSLLPVFVEKQLGLPPEFTTQIRVLSGVAGGLMALFGGALCDALGRKPSYLLAMTGVIASGLGFAIGQPGPLYPLSAFAGVMFGLGTVAGLSYVMEVAPKESLGLATAGYFLTGTLGNALGSAVAGWVAKEIPGGYALLGAAMALGHAALMLVAWALLPPLPRPPRDPGAPKRGGYGALLRRGEVWCLLGLRFLPTVYWGTATFLTPLLLFRMTGSEKPPGYYAGVSLVLSAASQLAMGRIVDRFGVRVPMVAAISLVTLATVGQGLLGHTVAGLVGFGLLGAGAAWSLSITMTTLVQELSDSGSKATLLGMTHMAWSGGFLTGTLITGRLAGPRGHSTEAFLVSAACCGVGILAAAAIAGVLRKRQHEGDSAGTILGQD